MLDVVKAQKLIKDVPSEELALRTMHKDKILEMCKPRERVYMDRDTPRRIKEMIMEHQKNDGFRDKQREKMRMSPTNKADWEERLERERSGSEKIKRRNMVLPRDKWGKPIVKRAKISQDDDERLEKITRPEFAKMQKEIRAQKKSVATDTVNQLFKQKNWTCIGYNSTKGLMNKFKHGINGEVPEIKETMVQPRPQTSKN